MTGQKVTTEVVENYLKAIYHARADEGASPQTIAAQMRVSASAVSKMLRHLEGLNLVVYAPYKPVQLTPAGEQIALEIIRHHRLLEAYLVQSLSYGWERAHAEADRLEHHISEEFEERIERLLGYPEFDPHGDPIPTRDGRIAARVTTSLASLTPPAKVVVRRVTDEDAALLKYLGSGVSGPARRSFCWSRSRSAARWWCLWTGRASGSAPARRSMCSSRWTRTARKPNAYPHPPARSGRSKQRPYREKKFPRPQFWGNFSSPSRLGRGWR